jgi:hypothetical protein
MHSAPESLYASTPKCLIILFDLRYLGAKERLQRERNAWDASASVEQLTADCRVLTFRPGGATRLAS